MHNCKKNPRKLKIQKQSENKIIKTEGIYLFKLKKENETIQHRIITDIKNLFLIYMGFLSRKFMIHRIAGEEGGYFFKSSLPLVPISQIRRH